MTEFESKERDELNHDFEFIAPKDFEGLSEIEITPYEGEGEMSFSSKYDRQKVKYLNSIGVTVPNEWFKENGEVIENCQALVSTMFITTGHILAMEKARRVLIESDPVNYQERFNQLVKDSNVFLLDRVDMCGRRTEILYGTMFEDIKRGLGFSANPQRKVSREELHYIVGHIFDSLKKPKEENFV